MSDKIRWAVRVAMFAYVVAFQYGFVKGYSFANEQNDKMNRRHREHFRSAQQSRVTPMPDRVR